MRTIIYLSLLILVLPCCGEAQDRMPLPPVTVIEDSDAVAEARRAWQVYIRSFASIKQLSSPHISNAEINVIALFPGHLVPQLKDVSADKEAPTLARCKAALLLLSAGETAPADAYAALTDPADTKSFNAAWKMMPDILFLLSEDAEFMFGRKRDFVKFIPAKTQAALVKLMESDNVRIAIEARDLCSTLRLPGTVKALQLALTRPKLRDWGACLELLIGMQPDKHALELAIAATKTRKPHIWTYENVASFLDSPDKKLAGHARDVLIDKLKEDISASDEMLMSRLTCDTLIRILRERGDRAFMTDLANERHGEPYLREGAVIELLRMDGAKARDRIFNYLQGRTIYDPDDHAGSANGISIPAVEAIGAIFAGSCDKDMAAAVFKLCNNREVEQLDIFAAIKATTRICPDHSMPSAKRLARRLDYVDAHAVDAMYKGQKVESLLPELVALKIIDKATANKAQTAIIGERRSEGVDPSVFRMLEHCGLVFRQFTWPGPFKDATGQIHHNLFLGNFAKGSRGIFKPEAATQTIIKKGGTDVDFLYRVEFIFSGKLFQFHARHFKDLTIRSELDAEALAQAANSALAAAGHRQRFYPLNTRGTGRVIYLYGPPALREFALKHDVPVVKYAEISQLIGKLSDQDPTIRREIRQQIEAIGPKSVPVLEDFLTADDPEIRYAVKNIIDRIKKIEQKQKESIIEGAENDSGIEDSILWDSVHDLDSDF